MLLSLSGENTSQDFNLDVVTNAGEGEIGVLHEDILLSIAEAVCNGEEKELALVREAALNILGSQALVDAIAVASGFNGITKVANATGLPLDETTENSTVIMRQQTKINDYTDAHKSELYRQ
jgi:hypothetical protein